MTDLGWWWGTYTLPDPVAKEALRPILERGRLSRLRMLQVVCANNHKLLQIVRTPAGPVVVGTSAAIDGSSHGDYDGSYWEEERHLHGRDTWCIRLDNQQPEHGYVVHCRCRQAQVPRDWIRQQITTGKRRVVWQPP